MNAGDERGGAGVVRRVRAGRAVRHRPDFARAEARADCVRGYTETMDRHEHSKPLGGIIHTYQKYDPVSFPARRAAAGPGVAGHGAHALLRQHCGELTEEELARAVQLDPSQIAGLGPSLEALMADARERKRKILETYETDTVQAEAARATISEQADEIKPPAKLRQAIPRRRCARSSSTTWSSSGIAAGDERGAVRPAAPATRRAARRQVPGRRAGRASTSSPAATPMTVPEGPGGQGGAGEDRQAAQAARRGDEDGADRHHRPGGAVRVRRAGRHGAARATCSSRSRTTCARWPSGRGWSRPSSGGFQLTPKAYRLFQSKLLTRDLQRAAGVAHRPAPGAVVGEGAVEMQQTKPYEFGDSVAQHGHPGVADQRHAPRRRRPAGAAEARGHRHPPDAQQPQVRHGACCMDMSGSMRYDGQYVNVKRMGLALDGLIRSEYPGDFLQFIEMYTFAKPRHVSRDRRR